MKIEFKEDIKDKCLHCTGLYVDHEITDKGIIATVECGRGASVIRGMGDDTRCIRGNDITIKVDKEKLRQELMQLMANCEDCDVPLPRFQCSERPCKFGINDRKIEEIIQNSIIIE